ncbi:MAG: deoxyribodipyrimidine photo-lyase [Bacteroidota bacterium]
MTEKLSIHWFRRDLRLDDNVGLFHALSSGKKVLPIFIFDPEILDELPQKDGRVEFIHDCLHDIQQKLRELGSSLLVKYGPVEESWKSIIAEYPIAEVFTNRDYEPYAIKRDQQITDLLAEQGISFHHYRDQVLFEQDEILSKSNKPYTVFTPFSKNWRSQLTKDRLKDVGTEALFGNFWKSESLEIPSLESMSFERTGLAFPARIPDKEIIKVYDQKRNFPAQKGTTRIGIHLRFGTMSIRKLARVAIKLNDTYLNELIWREFYMQILYNFPHVVDRPFRPAYAEVPWLKDEASFEKWCQGKTGYPMVDAGMRELNETGYMHNRVRMVVASFLSKHLLLNWQWGEAYFAEKLLDFELSSNSGGWQWAAGCGTDAAPYFRIFNPESQMKKFDPKLKYVRKWVPEYGTPLYPKPIVEHKFARERCLEAYKSVLGRKEAKV